MSQKSYDNSATLYLIPTPIGNMDDITLRAIKILTMVEAVFSEDTRVTAQLLNHHNIKKKLIANHQHNEPANKEKLLNYLKEGFSIGLVTDRGTPLVSDPGSFLVSVAIDNGYNVVCLPGATALIPALAVSGIKTMPFLFYGFLDSKTSHRKKELLSLKDEQHTIILYEAPHRLKKTLADMLEIMGERHIAISREISKKFEEVYRGTISDVIIEIGEPRGEIVIVVDGNHPTDMGDISIEETVNIYIKQGYSIMDAIKKTAKDREITKNEVYDVYHKIKR